MLDETQLQYRTQPMDKGGAVPGKNKSDPFFLVLYDPYKMSLTAAWTMKLLNPLLPFEATINVYILYSSVNVLFLLFLL